jgi:hypothetical protein
MLVTATPAGIEKYFEEAFYPGVEGKEPPMSHRSEDVRSSASCPYLVLAQVQTNGRLASGRGTSATMA